MLAELTRDVAAGQPLDATRIAAVVAMLVDESAPPEPKADFLVALADRGEGAAEIAGFARELLARSVPVPLPAGFREGRELLDVCGTGGDGLNTFNISTTVALVCAAAGVPVAKHGNRAVTSKSGSADVLQALGIPVDLPPAAAAEAIVTHGFAFLFAPALHPAFKGIAPARRLCAARGRRTIFNFLGPLVNPARPTAQLLGVSRPELVGPLAETLQAMGLRRAMVASGDVPGHGTLDELSTLGVNRTAEFHHPRAIALAEWSPSDFPVRPATLADLAGGDATANAGIIRNLLSGSDTGPRRDAVLLNAAAALCIAGRVRSMGAGWELAGSLIGSGAAGEKLRELAAA